MELTPICPEGEESEAGWPRTTASSSTGYSGSCAPASWRDLPPDYGGWKNTQRRFCRWRDKSLWECLLEIFVTAPDFEWLFIDATHVKTHAHGTGAKGSTQEDGRTKEGLTRKYTWPWMLRVCRSEFLLRRIPSLIALKLTD
jgi:hypothetical protein